MTRWASGVGAHVVVAHVVVAAALAVSVGCSGGDREDNEARLLLDRSQRLEHPDLGERSRRVEELAAMPLSAPDLVAIRDACVSMHSALITAERSTAEAHAALAALERLPAVEQEAPGAGRAVGAALERSKLAVQTVRDSRTACQDGIAGLRVRFGR